MDTNCKKCWTHPSILGTPLPKCNNKEITECCITKTKKKKSCCCSEDECNNDQKAELQIVGGGSKPETQEFNKEIYKDENY